MAATSQASRTGQTAAGQPKKKRPKLYGKEKPRVFTPPLRPLEPRSPETEQWTLGYDVIDFAEEVLKITLYPWQKWLLVHMLELLEDGQLRFRTVIVLIARQNGKSTLSQVLAIWIICVWGWPLVLGTAQDLETAEEVWQGAVDMVEESEELSPLIDKVVKVNGKKALEIIRDVEDYRQAKKRSKTRYKVKAANRKAGRGFTGNLILLDELREHQNWDAWGAITKTTMAQIEALVLALSNAGDVTSVVLRYLRQMGHEGAGDPDGICQSGEDLLPDVIDLGMSKEDDPDDEGYDEDDEWEQEPDTLGLFEWSAIPGCSKWDREGWAQANPSVGWNPGFSERTLVAACKTDPEWVFRTECMCQWSDGVLEGPFPPGVWEEGQNKPEIGPDSSTRIAEEDRIVSDVTVGLAQSSDREYVYMARAGYRADGQPQVELVAARHGTEWTFGYLMNSKRRDSIKGVTGQSKGAQVSALMEDLSEAKSDPEIPFDVPVIPWQGTDLTNGWARYMDFVTEKKLRHHKQPPLDLAATTAVLKTFSGGATIPDDKASPSDTAPLMATVAALWLLTRKDDRELPPPPPPAAVKSADLDTTYGNYTGGMTAGQSYASDIGSIGF